MQTSIFKVSFVVPLLDDIVGGIITGAGEGSFVMRV